MTDGKICTVCGETTVAQEVIEAGHKYENGVCTACGNAENGSVEEDSTTSESTSEDVESVTSESTSEDVESVTSESGSEDADSVVPENSSVAGDSESSAVTFGCVSSAGVTSLVGVIVMACAAYAMKKREE